MPQRVSFFAYRSELKAVWKEIKHSIVTVYNLNSMALFLLEMYHTLSTIKLIIRPGNVASLPHTYVRTYLPNPSQWTKSFLSLIGMYWHLALGQVCLQVTGLLLELLTGQ